MNTITYYLDMQHPEQIRAKPLPADLSVVECQLKQFQLNRFLYQLVGEPWQWTDKLSWTDAQWRALIEQANHRTWVAYHQGAIAGYYELLRDADGAVEILYFGLAEAFFGQGFGGPLLTHALQCAWAWPGTTKVWVHTCSLDHPSALANYQARGLRIYREEVEADVS
ncbi:GNAT family N-acetyltransferase [Pseudomonas anguilliseptica]|uniref:GNAT family N-acetyltransferase n=1 Tax=Pseudomonas anguilliseptica TaxID=53406 RepID=UPI0022AEAD8E|nr:GNAT family N-acetyltransferase [Pseudomonas anguilliseptica]MCZ4323767.1 GNAT family N-acetyltransferase [Pseudomonas anguilliseptica]